MPDSKSPRIRIGNSFAADAPACGTMSGFRVGSRSLGSYTYATMPVESPAISSRDITVDEVKRFFDRVTKPEMTTGATMFAPLCTHAEDFPKGFDGGSEVSTMQYEHDYYTRLEEEHMLLGVDAGDVRAWGLGDIEDETIGMQFRIYERRAVDPGTGDAIDTSEHRAYFDNARFEVSNILWEFSPDGGEQSWYQMFDLPNRAYTRMTLPEATTTLRARAISNSPDEWIQAFAITPVPDMQGK